MANKVSIVDFVHAIFKNNVVDICQKGDEFLLGTRMSDKIAYDDGRKILYSVNVYGLGSTKQVLEKLGVSVAPERPMFKEGDKDLIAKVLLDEIKQKIPNWSDFLDDHIAFKKGGKGYVV